MKALFNVKDKVQFIDKLHIKYAWMPRKNITYTINSRAMDKINYNQMYYSIEEEPNGNSICWIKEEDLANIKETRNLKLQQLTDESR